MFRLIGFLILSSLFVTLSCQQQDNYQSHAEEIFPPVQLKYAALYRLDSLPVSLTFFQDQWTIVIFGDPVCNPGCMDRLDLINDVKMAKKLFVVNGLARHDKLRELAKKFPNVAITMGATASSFDSFFAQFDTENVDSPQKTFQLYLVNPSAELVYNLTAENMSSDDLDKELDLIK